MFVEDASLIIIQEDNMSFIDRIVYMILTPKTEWGVIAAEEPDADSIFIRYALPLIIASTAVAVIGYTFVWTGGVRGTDALVTRGMYYGIETALIGTLGLWLTAVIVNALAQYFGSEKNMGRSMQLVAYAMTPIWLGGLLMIYPPIGFIGILFGFYGLYLLYLRLPQLMKTPQDNIVKYRLISIVILLDIYIGLGILFRMFIWDAMTNFLTHVLINAHPLK